ncbi:DUF6122 family protein [Arenibacter sp. F26102]|uniref:DUF6122 family protein n=1 Tax=Arenibacter sp. F26102 TaxID=2926416 RepID=UPI001FF52D79|nr:DUF6122 family protein [Arenibacter sp. F26102]MCK0145130.1 DUF6122 family protein [Arenibacter sp. F26102]
MLRFCVHYGIHFLLPIVIGLYFYKEHRLQIILILLAGILIDLDHLLANPIFDSNRCSINFHLLHTYWAISGYFLLLFFQKTRVFGIAFLIHILADTADCYLM